MDKKGEINSAFESLLGRNLETNIWYYSAQLFMLGVYLFLIRIGRMNTLIVVILVAILRPFSSGIAFLTIAMVLGRDFVINQAKKRES